MAEPDQGAPAVEDADPKSAKGGDSTDDSGAKPSDDVSPPLIITTDAPPGK